jgi:PAS domain S-box-containing protein
MGIQQRSDDTSSKMILSSANSKLFGTLFKESADALQLVDLDGRVLYSSDSVKKVLGYTPEEIQGVIVAPYIHPDDFTSFSDKWGRLLEQPKSTVTLEYRVKHKKGHWVFVETTLTNHLGTKNINAIVGNFRNITERKRIARLLEEQIAALKTITDNASLGLIMMDDRQRCSFLNLAAEKILGITFEEIQKIDKPLHDVIHHTKPDGSPYHIQDCPIDRAFPQHMRTRGEDCFVRPTGEFYPVEFTASPIKKGGNISGTVIEVRDITEQKAAEREIRRLNEIEIQRDKLIELNKSKDEFISLASHQLRTPATVVKQYAGLLLDDILGPMPEQQKDVLKKLYDSNDRQIEIINDLLKIARIDSGKIELNRRDVNMTNLIRSVFDDLTESAKEKNIDLHFQISIDRPAVQFDSDLIRTAIENLVDNAIKYSYQNSKVIVRVRELDKYLEIAVTDNGVGIPLPDRKRLFERFVRLPNPLSISSGGTGLGLYWVRRVLELHKGKVKVTANKPSGTIFRIILPKDT